MALVRYSLPAAQSHDQLASFIHEIVGRPDIEMTFRLSPLLYIQGSQLLDWLHGVTRLGATSQRQPIVFPSRIEHQGAKLADNRH
jgi:hypothetical protein